jgi:hypothetical protein
MAQSPIVSLIRYTKTDMWRFFQKRNARKKANQSDFGRRYGWLLLYQGRCVAELEYINLEDQFWHKYRIKWAEMSDLASIACENWQEFGIRIRSMKYPEIEFQNYMATSSVDGNILLRGVYVPMDVL